jgi:hypothetical protein
MTDDVLPWEQMKLRMLNGSHSFLAWLGYLAGGFAADGAGIFPPQHGGDFRQRFGGGGGNNAIHHGPGRRQACR